jgi:hypothetical protein
METLMQQRWPGIAADFVLPTEMDAAAMVQYALTPRVRAKNT